MAIFEKSYETIRAYRCPHCNGRGNINFAKSGESRVIVLHYPDCPLWQSLAAAYPRLIERMKRDNAAIAA
jgi:hypothetical protein